MLKVHVSNLFSHTLHYNLKCFSCCVSISVQVVFCTRDRHWQSVSGSLSGTSQFTMCVRWVRMLKVNVSNLSSHTAHFRLKCCRSCFIHFSVCMLTISVSNLFSHTVQFSLGRNVWKQDLPLCWCAQIAASVARQLLRTIHSTLHFSTFHRQGPCRLSKSRCNPAACIQLQQLVHGICAKSRGCPSGMCALTFVGSCLFLCSGCSFDVLLRCA